MNNAWIQISYNTPYWAHLKKSQRFAWVKNEKNAVKLHEVIFKYHRNCLHKNEGNWYMIEGFITQLSYGKRCW